MAEAVAASGALRLAAALDGARLTVNFLVRVVAATGNDDKHAEEEQEEEAEAEAEAADLAAGLPVLSDDDDDAARSRKRHAAGAAVVEPAREEECRPHDVGVFWVQRHSRGTGQPKDTFSDGDAGAVAGAATASNGRNVESSSGRQSGRRSGARRRSLVYKKRVLVGRIDGCEGGQLGISTTHTHEFMLIRLRRGLEDPVVEAFGSDGDGDDDDDEIGDSNSNPRGELLLRWVANVTKGEHQTAAVDISSSRNEKAGYSPGRVQLQTGHAREQREEL